MNHLLLVQLNALPRDAFISALSDLFEGPPWIVEQAEGNRPFHTLDDLYSSLIHVMDSAPRDQQLALLRAHPDLVGRAALAGTLSPASTAEQSAAGLDALTPAEIADFSRLNTEYQAKFGFPFVICARENKKDSILAGFAARLNNSPDDETATALAEVAKICRLRLLDTVSTS